MPYVGPQVPRIGDTASSRVSHHLAPTQPHREREKRGREGRGALQTQHADHTQISLLAPLGIGAGESLATLPVRLKTDGKVGACQRPRISSSRSSAPSGPGLATEASPGSLQRSSCLCWACLGQRPRSVIFLTQAGRCDWTGGSWHLGHLGPVGHNCSTMSRP